MQYDPIKRSLGSVFNRKPCFRILFYKLLDLLLLRTWHIKRELRKWHKQQKNEAKILDAGAGFGQYSYFISTLNKNYSIKAVDVKQEQIDDCNRFFTQIKKNQNVKFEYADLVTFSEKDEYDLVLSVDVMEHILEDCEVFKNFYFSMKEGAMLLISTPRNTESTHKHEHSFIDEHVRDGYKFTEIVEKLRQAGFSNIEPHYSYGKTGNLAWIISMKYPIIMLNFSKLFFIILPFYYLLMFPFALILNYLDLNTKHKSGSGLIVKAWK